MYVQFCGGRCSRACARISRQLWVVAAGLLVPTAALATTGGAAVEHGTTFRDASGDVAGFARARSADFAAQQAIRTQSLEQPWASMGMPFTPMASHGLSGTSVFDFDNDGDLDIFASNGAGAANVLYANQLAETGTLSFVEVAAAAGLAAADAEANGSCHGDLDNDGDDDLLVLGRAEGNRLYENLGDGTFVETLDHGMGLDTRSHVGCSMGDIDGDGLLDVVIGNAFPLATLEAIFIEPFAMNEHNQLYRNDGDLLFDDVSDISGVENLAYLPEGEASITWAIALVDIDHDGDVDIVHADDQGGIPTAKYGGLDRGFIQVLANDGTGQFTAQSGSFGDQTAGSWMGVGFGDLDCDGAMDVFGSNFGDYHMPTIGMPYELGDQATRVLYGSGSGGLIDDGWGAEGTAFGWGNAVFDADNDGDSDAVYFGGLEMLPIGLRDNPGILVENHECTGLSTNVTAMDARHQSRNVRGVAIGDLDRDGFVDIVTTSNWDVPDPVPVLPGPAQYGGILDQFATFVPTFAPTDETGESMVWTGIDYAPGSLRVDLNDGNTNGGVTVKVMGTVGIDPNGQVNRGGVGAVVSFTPRGADTEATMPITAGSSHSASHASEAYFGLGSARAGYVDVLWPGGTRNRLYGVRADVVVTIPEIPCSIDAEVSFRDYRTCVRGSLDILRDSGIITAPQRARLFVSAVWAYVAEH